MASDIDIFDPSTFPEVFVWVGYEGRDGPCLKVSMDKTFAPPNAVRFVNQKENISSKIHDKG